MKFSSVVISSIIAAVSASKTKSLTREITADSTLGSKLLSKARRLDENDEIDYTWITDMSIKFQGCFHISQWNNQENGDEDVRIMTKRLVRFRLCPTDSCSAENAGACDSGYGDYIVDMNTYVDAYFEAKRQSEEEACKNLEENVCVCEDNGDDGWDEDVCMQECYAANNMSYCYREEGAFEAEQYLECNNFEAPDDDGRRLEEDEEIEYFVGPYCGDQGGDIYLGMFTDDTCTEFADEEAGRSTYKSFVGSSLPYSSRSIVGQECVSCLKVEEDDNNNNNNNDDKEPEMTEMCEQLYQGAGKCESGLDIDYPNENACSYIEGIKIIRKSGTVTMDESGSSGAVNAVIGLFVVSTCLLGYYAFYLKQKLSADTTPLSES